jgi:hypothetical protein
MKPLLLLTAITAIIAINTTEVLAQVNSPTTDDSVGTIRQSDSQLIITGALAKSLYFQLDQKLEMVAYTANCGVNVPGCANRVGVHLYCTNGDTGEPSVNYKCYVDLANITHGEFRTRELPPWVK